MTGAETTGTSGSLIYFLAASLLVIGLTYAASRTLGRWQTTHAKGRRLRVLEGLPVGRDRSLLLVAVGKELLVVGTGPGGITLVHQVTDPELAAEVSKPGETSPGALPETPVERSIRANLERMQALLAGRKAND